MVRISFQIIVIICISLGAPGHIKVCFSWFMWYVYFKWMLGSASTDICKLIIMLFSSITSGYSPRIHLQSPAMSLDCMYFPTNILKFVKRSTIASILPVRPSVHKTVPTTITFITHSKMHFRSLTNFNGCFTHGKCLLGRSRI